MRTDEHRNPTAFTTDIAKQAGLILGTDYEIGKAFPSNSTMATAKLLADPIVTTIRVIDAIGFYTKSGIGRWTYISMPDFIWHGLTLEEKRDVIGFMYHHEGGAVMIPLFPNYNAR